MTNYEITKVSPQQLKLQVKYTKDGSPDYWINFQITDFSESNLHEVAQGGAGKAEDFWQSIAQLPSEVTPAASTGVAKARVYANAPDHNEMTHNASFQWVETDDAITQTWTVTEKTDAENAQALAEWRNKTSVTMRQARLALIEQGLLSQVQDGIALIPEPDRSKIQTEWEYASTVERGSVWVSILQPALSLTDEQMDDLFKLAGTL